MRRYRFHVAELLGDTVTVRGAEARHAAAVLRLNPGTEVELFDGKGSEVTGVIESIDSESMVISITLRREAAPSVVARLTLATAIPKGPRADWMVEKCAELGVAELQPIQFARSVVEPGGGKLDRWRRLAVSAAKQCGATTAMSIAAPIRLLDFLAQGHAISYYGVTTDEGPSLVDELMQHRRDAADRSVFAIIIGPEGGLTPEEASALQSAGARPATWASTVLRIETAAIAAAAIFASLFGNPGADSARPASPRQY